MGKGKMKKTANRALSFILSTLLIVGMLPAVAFAKTGDTPITGFSAADNSFIEGDLGWGDQYNLDNTAYTVSTDDGESFTGPMWDVLSWLGEKYPELETEGYVNWEKTEDPSQGVAGDSFKIVYYLDGFEAEWTLSIAENPIASIEARDVKCIEGDTYEENGYEDAEGNWQEVKWQKYIFSPNLKVTLKDGESYESENGDCWEVYDWLKGKTGTELNFWWNDNDCQNPPTGVGIGDYTVIYEIAGFSGTYTATVVKNPIVSMTNDPEKVEIYEGIKNERDGYWDEEAQEWIPDYKWYAYDTYPHNMTVKTDDGDSIENADWWDCRQWLEEKYNLSFSDGADGDTQSPSHEWTVGDYPITFRLGPATMNYTISIVENPVQSVSAVGFKRLEGDTDTRDRYWDEEKQEDIFEDWEAYGTWPESIRVVTKAGTFEGDPNDVRRELAEALGKTEDEINREGFGDENDDQSPTNPWGVGVHHQRFSVCGIYADYDMEIVANPVKSVSVEDKTVFQGDTYTESGYWGPEGEWIEKEWQRYDTWPSKITVEMNGGDTIEGEPNQVYDQVREIIGFGFNFGDRNDGQDPDHPWGLGDHEVQFVFAGRWTTYNVEMVDDPIESVTVNKDVYLTEGDTYTSDGYRNDKGEWIEVQTDRYGYMPYDITVTVKKEALVKGTQTTFTGDTWEVRAKVAEALGISEDNIRVEIYDDQTPDNVWEPGEHDSVFSFAGKTSGFKVIIVPFPIAKVSVDKSLIIDKDAPKADLDKYIDFETGRETYLENTFKGYDPAVDEITVTFKNGVKKTGGVLALQEEVMNIMAEESGLPEECVFFPVYGITDQRPDAGWEPGYHMARFNFGPVNADYSVIILGDNGDYNGLYNDQTNNRYIYLEHGFMDEGYTGMVQGQVASVIDGKNPKKTQYVANSDGNWYVVNGVVEKNNPGLKSAVDEEGKTSFYFINDEGRQDTSKTGFENYNGAKFFVLNGLLLTNKNGLTQDPNNRADWYFVAAGKVVSNKTGLVMFNGSTFYVVKGKQDTSVSGILKYDTGLFYVDKGRVIKTAKGLVQDPKNKNDWYFVSNGQVQKQKTGIAIYNKAGFYVENGKLNSKYTGTIVDNGKKYNVVNGRVV